MLFLVLDNTTGENKTGIMLLMGAWLVATKRFKQVRVYFLPVGHTHILIDQIFGVITSALRQREILTPERLVSHINGALARNTQYNAQPVQWLHSLFDVWAWYKECVISKEEPEGLFKRPQMVDADGRYYGMND